MVCNLIVIIIEDIEQENDILINDNKYKNLGLIKVKIENESPVLK